MVHDTGMQLTRVREKLSLQDLYPPPPGSHGEESLHRGKDDGGGVNAEDQNAEKISLQDLSPQGIEATLTTSVFIYDATVPCSQSSLKVALSQVSKLWK